MRRKRRRKRRRNKAVYSTDTSILRSRKCISVCSMYRVCRLQVEKVDYSLLTQPLFCAYVCHGGGWRRVNKGVDRASRPSRQIAPRVSCRAPIQFLLTPYPLVPVLLTHTSCCGAYARSSRVGDRQLVHRLTNTTTLTRGRSPFRGSAGMMGVPGAAQGEYRKGSIRRIKLIDFVYVER